MSLYHVSQIYNNIKSTIRLSEGVLYLSIKDENNSEVSLSFNPKQARILGEYLQVLVKNKRSPATTPNIMATSMSIWSLPTTTSKFHSKRQSNMPLFAPYLPCSTS